MASLVITNAASKSWPAGWVSFRATDWIGSSGAASEVDTRAVEGEAVRETQLTANTIRTQEQLALQNADDTLEIDISGVPVELNQDYFVYVSALIEGDWDATSIESRRRSSPARFVYTARLGLFGDDNYPDDTFFNLARHYGRNRDHYLQIEFGDVAYFTTGTEVLHIRALGGPGSSIEWLIDQVVLVPGFLTDGTTVGGGYGIRQDSPIVDGADGGDDNGKFTWHPRQNTLEEITDMTGEDGGGDYQQDDSEYMVQVGSGDTYFFGGTATAAAYSLTGPYYHVDETPVTDSFTRTVGGNSFGSPGAPFTWSQFIGREHCTISADGSRGLFHFTGVLPRDAGWAGQGLNVQGSDASFQWAEVCLENVIYSGVFEVSWGSAPFDGSTTSAGVMLELQPGDTIDAGVSIGGIVGSVGISPVDGIYFDILGEQWKVGFHNIDVSSWVDVSSWWGNGVEVGFRIEVRRHMVRARLWDASGAEPSTWDVDDFMPIHGWPTASDDTDWDYSNDPLGAKQRYENFNPCIRAWGDGYVAQWDVFLDDVVVEYDAGGALDQTGALMEAPDGNEVDRITIPVGAQHFVYWGTRDWTTPDGFGDFNLDFSAKVWTDTGAAELQRAEVPWWWFREGEFRIVSMNWRIADRTGVATRVLVGE